MVLARVVYALGKEARYRHREAVPIADLESGSFDPYADYTDLYSALLNSAVPVQDLHKIIGQLWTIAGMTCSWPKANTPSSKPWPQQSLLEMLALHCCLPASHMCKLLSVIILCHAMQLAEQPVFAGAAVHCLTASLALMPLRFKSHCRMFEPKHVDCLSMPSAVLRLRI